MVAPPAILVAVTAVAINVDVFKLTVTATDPLYVTVVPLRPLPMVNALATLPAPKLPMLPLCTRVFQAPHVVSIPARNFKLGFDVALVALGLNNN